MTDAGKIVPHVNLCVGQSVTCLLNKVFKVESQFVGFIEKDCFMLQWLHFDKKWENIAPNSSFAAHVRLNSSLIFFSSTIEYIYEKKKLFICTHPAFFKVFEARVTQRFCCFIPIALSLNDEYILAVTQDISHNGCHLVIEPSYYQNARAIQLKDILTAEFAVGLAGSFMLSAEVVYLKQDLASTHIGLHFTSISPHDAGTLKQLIQSHQHEICL